MYPRKNVVISNFNPRKNVQNALKYPRKSVYLQKKQELWKEGY